RLCSYWIVGLRQRVRRIYFVTRIPKWLPKVHIGYRKGRRRFRPYPCRQWHLRALSILQQSEIHGVCTVLRKEFGGCLIPDVERFCGIRQRRLDFSVLA